MGGIDETREFQGSRGRELRQGRVNGGWAALGGWQGGITTVGGLVVDDSPMLGLAQIFCHLLKHVEVDIVGASAELRKGYTAVAHIWTAGDIGMEEFP